MTSLATRTTGKVRMLPGASTWDVSESMVRYPRQAAVSLVIRGPANSPAMSVGSFVSQTYAPGRGSSDAYVRAAALSRPAAYRVLSRLNEAGAVSFDELDEHLTGGADWIAVAQLVRARYAREGLSRLHVTDRGRRALAAFRDRHPELSR